jgi:hypothetical protein
VYPIHNYHNPFYLEFTVLELLFMCGVRNRQNNSYDTLWPHCRFQSFIYFDACRQLFRIEDEPNISNRFL